MQLMQSHPNERTIPIQLIIESLSLKIIQAITALNKTIPMLLIGMIAELLLENFFNTRIRNQIEK